MKAKIIKNNSSSIFFFLFFFVTRILSHKTVNIPQNITDRIDVTQQLEKNSHHADNPRAHTTKGVFSFFVNPVHDNKKKKKKNTVEKKTVVVETALH